MTAIILTLAFVVQPIWPPSPERENVPPILLQGVEEWWWLPFDAEMYEGEWHVDDIPYVPDWG